MNKQKMVQSLNKVKFSMMKHSPEIFMYAGAVGVLGATVLACRSTLKLTEVLDKSKKTIDTIHNSIEDEEIEYTHEDAKKDLAIVYTSTALDIVKLYTPAVILGGLSIGAMFRAHNILSKRNAALAAAFTTATESFANYRKAVVDKYGERVDYELRHGIKAEKITTKDEDGKTKKETIDVAKEINGCSDYARFFDENCSGWTNDPEANLYFLKAQQQYANDKLIAQGYLFLNDVYKMLGIPESKAGQVVGWRYNPDRPEGDNYVDFGMYDVSVSDYRDDDTNDTIGEERRDFINGYKSTTLLDFNVDGNIWETMGE